MKEGRVSKDNDGNSSEWRVKGRAESGVHKECNPRSKPPKIRSDYVWPKVPQYESQTRLRVVVQTEISA